MKRPLWILATAALSLSLLAGCSIIGNGVPAGFLFTYARIPYTHDLNNTAMTDFEADGRVVRIKEPLTGYGIYTELNTNAIGDIAARHGIHEVYFADLEILSILGIFNHNKLYIYGK